jgi:hypothetical protein
MLYFLETPRADDSMCFFYRLQTDRAELCKVCVEGGGIKRLFKEERYELCYRGREDGRRGGGGGECDMKDYGRAAEKGTQVFEERFIDVERFELLVCTEAFPVWNLS